MDWNAVETYKLSELTDAILCENWKDVRVDYLCMFKKLSPSMMKKVFEIKRFREDLWLYQEVPESLIEELDMGPEDWKWAALNQSLSIPFIKKHMKCILRNCRIGDIDLDWIDYSQFSTEDLIKYKLPVKLKTAVSNKNLDFVQLFTNDLLCSGTPIVDSPRTRHHLRLTGDVIKKLSFDEILGLYTAGVNLCLEGHVYNFQELLQFIESPRGLSRKWLVSLLISKSVYVTVGEWDTLVSLIAIGNQN